MKRAKIAMFRQGRLSLHLIPILIWVTAAVAVGALFLQRAERCEVVGLAVGETYEVAATSNGRVKSLAAKLFQQVQAGETLAVINTVLDNENLRATLEARRDTIEAEIARLKTELTSAEEQLNVELADRESQREAEFRRVSVDLERSRIAMLELEAMIEPDRIMLKDLELEVRIVKDLLAKEAVEAYELQKAESQYNILAKKIEENERLLAQAKKDAEGASLRLAKFESKETVNPSLGISLNPIRAAISVQYKMIDELLLDQVAQRDSLLLMAPFDGVICRIQRRPGEAVLLGEPIMTIAKATPDMVVAWVREEQMDRVREGRPVRIVTRGSSQQIAMSEVSVVGPTVELLPERLWRAAGVAEYGLPFEVSIPPGLRLKPEEKVGIKLL